VIVLCASLLQFINKAVDGVPNFQEHKTCMFFFVEVATKNVYLMVHVAGFSLKFFI